jgi:hypothetical protein
VRRNSSFHSPIVLRELALDTGLVGGVTAALADTYAGPWVHAPGRCSRIWRWRSLMARTVFPMSRCSGTGMGCVVRWPACRPRGGCWIGSTGRICPGVAAARAAARDRAWAAGAGPDLTGLLQIDVDATITISHSEDKENAAKTWKRTFGFHPLLAFLDRPEVSAVAPG